MRTTQARDKRTPQLARSLVSMTSRTNARTQRDADLLGTDAGGQLVTRRVRVRVTAGPAAGEERVLERGSLVVGSGASADLQIRDPRVSRAHVELALVGTGVRVRDVGSTNGTFLGEARVEALVVQPGVELRLGSETRLELSAADVPAPVLPSERTSFGRLTGASPAMRQLYTVLERVAPTDVPLSIEGEAGTGKSEAAQAVHEASRRSAERLETIELSGHVDHAALEHAFARARRGTLVLDHADSMSAATAQALAPLLDRVERGELDVRTIATSRSDLRAAVESGSLGRDLFFRLATVRAIIPPLRARLADLTMLVRALGLELTGEELALDSHELAALRSHDFPGNVRELRARMEEALVLRPAAAREAEPAAPFDSAALDGVAFHDAKERVVDAFEREYVRRLLDRHGGNLSRAADEAGLSRNHLTTLARKHGLR